MDVSHQVVNIRCSLTIGFFNVTFGSDRYFFHTFMGKDYDRHLATRLTLGLFGVIAIFQKTRSIKHMEVKENIWKLNIVSK